MSEIGTRDISSVQGFCLREEIEYGGWDRSHIIVGGFASGAQSITLHTPQRKQTGEVVANLIVVSKAGGAVKGSRCLRMAER